MSGVNKVILIGNLGADPEIRHLDNGATVANFRIATTEKLRVKVTDDKGMENWENREQTEWHNLVAWRGLATVVERYLRKGSKIYVEGKLRTRQWEDKDGNPRYTTEVLVNELTMLDRASGEQQQQQSQSAATAGSPVTAGPATEDPHGDDLPF